jgi:hypothetical protein
MILSSAPLQYTVVQVSMHHVRCLHGGLHRHREHTLSDGRQTRLLLNPVGYRIRACFAAASLPRNSLLQ